MYFLLPFPCQRIDLTIGLHRWAYRRSASSSSMTLMFMATPVEGRHAGEASPQWNKETAVLAAVCAKGEHRPGMGGDWRAVRGVVETEAQLGEQWRSDAWRRQRRGSASAFSSFLIARRRSISGCYVVAIGRGRGAAEGGGGRVQGLVEVVRPEVDGGKGERRSAATRRSSSSPALRPASRSPCRSYGERSIWSKWRRHRRLGNRGRGIRVWTSRGSCHLFYVIRA